MAMRVHDFLVRHRWALLAAVVVHGIVVHYFFLGYSTWDGFGHRVPPIVELVKHGALNTQKLDNWALVGFRPFVELVNAPFLWMLGLDGLYFAAAFVLPLAAAAVHLFVRELTGDAVAAFYAAATYVLFPVVSAQVFAGYVDWAIPALLAFFLYALLRVRDRANLAPYVLLSGATFLFTMSRQQAPYLAVVLFCPVVAMTFRARRDRRVLAATTASFLAGIAPAAFLHARAFARFGTPIHPYQFGFVGLSTRQGWTLENTWLYAGLDDLSVQSFSKATLKSWLWPGQPPCLFYDSRFLGAGLFCLLAICALPFVLPRTNTITRVVLAAFAVLSILGRDFWLPRFAYTLLLAVCICVGLAFSRALARRPLYFALVAMAFVHAFRPEWDAWRVVRGDRYFRMNAAATASYTTSAFDVPVYPDRGARLVIIGAPANGFALPLYGRKLTNEIVGTVPAHTVGAACAGLRPQPRDALFVDDADVTSGCKRTCAIEAGRCLAYAIDVAE